MKSKSKPYFLYGKHTTLAALQNPKRQIINALCTQDFLCNPEFKKHITKLNYKIITKAYLDKLLGTSSVHQGIAIETLPITSQNLDSINLSSKQTVVILDHLTDNQNFGSILRSAVTFNITNIIIPSDHCVKENGGLAKAASGALELVNMIEVVNINQAIETLKKNGFWVIGLDHDAQTKLHEYAMPPKLAIVLGSEDQGIRKLTRSKCDTLVKIPIIQSNLIDSLNVSVAASITFYEIFKTTNLQ
jgi:23S rRNA (guanosine2251-2'-O)-methyltransferase